MKKKNNNWMWIIGAVIVFIIFFNPGTKEGKKGFSCSSSGGTPSTTCEWVSGEPTTISGYRDFLINKDFEITHYQSEILCPDQAFPNACMGPRLEAQKEEEASYFNILQFPSFLDGPDVTLDSCSDYLFHLTKSFCGEATGIYKDSCSECVDLGYSRCYSNDETLGKQITTDTKGYNYIYTIIEEILPIYYICSTNNNFLVFTTHKNIFDEFYTYQCS